jgi:GAF domain-containing protein
MGQSIRDALAGQMQYTYFPVELEQFSANVRYHDLVEGSFQIGDIRVTTRYLNHTALTLGYRLEVDGVVIVYSTDHEPHSRQLAIGHGPIGGEDYKHMEFVAGADVLIHDAQYLAAEYATKVNWGHSTMEYVVEIARAAKVKRLALYHHDPQRVDEALDRIVNAARSRITGADAVQELFAAAEGQVLELAGDPPAASGEREDDVVRVHASMAMPSHAILLGMEDGAMRETIAELAGEDGLRVLVAADEEAILGLARSERPSLILLDHQLGGSDGGKVWRTLRKDGSYGQDVAIVLVAPKEQAAALQAATAAGVSDWLITPFSNAYLRTRVRAWILRTSCNWTAPEFPADEARRLQALNGLHILDTPPEERFDRITRLAAALFDVPISLVSLVDAERQWFKSCFGTEVRETPREVSFCGHAILGKEVMLVPDALADPRFAGNPLVTGPTRIRFYAGVPLSLPDGSCVGALCVVDRRPRQFDGLQIRLLKDLGTLVEEELIRILPS